MHLRFHWVGPGQGILRYLINSSDCQLALHLLTYSLPTLSLQSRESSWKEFLTLRILMVRLLSSRQPPAVECMSIVRKKTTIQTFCCLKVRSLEISTVFISLRSSFRTVYYRIESLLWWKQVIDFLLLEFLLHETWIKLKHFQGVMFPFPSQ